MLYWLAGLWVLMFLGRHAHKCYLDKKLEELKKEKEGKE